MSKELKFTGNWFIDLGILGFVNLMEEVYGKEYQSTHEWFYYAFFIFYVKKTVKDWISRQGIKKKTDTDELFFQDKETLLKEIENIIEKSIKRFLTKEKNRQSVRNELKGINSEIKKKIIKTFQRYKSFLNKPLNNKDIIDKVNSIGVAVSESFFQNLNFLNPSKNKFGKEDEVLASFETMLFEHKIKDELTVDAFDKTISKFIFSEKEFPNVIMGKIPTIETLKGFVPVDDPIFLLLSFPASFIKTDRFMAFYTPNFQFTYSVNKKLKTYLDMARKKSQSEILKLTWQSIIDFLFETKAEFSLENMYLIEYENIIQQELKGVQYIGIPKLQAEFIIDDKIREALNQKIKVLEKGDKQYQWLLQEFIKNKPLLPIFYRNLGLYFTQKDSNSKQKRKFKNTKSLIYSAALDKVIAELNIKKTNLFSDDFFFRNKLVLEKAKDTIRGYFHLKSIIGKLFSQDSPDERKTLAYRLFSRLRKNQKYSFVNEILKALNGKDVDDVKTLINHIFRNILSNDKTWQSDAVPFLAGLIGGGSDE